MSDNDGNKEGEGGSKWNVEIPWQEGKDEDFSNFPLKKEDTEKAESSSDEDSVERPMNFAEINQQIATESEDEDDDKDDIDPGEGNPGKRILWAAQHNKLELAREMLLKDSKLVASKDEDEYTPLHRASYSGHLEMVKLLIRMGADPLAPSDTGWIPLHSAAKWNQYQVVEYFLSIGVPVNISTEGMQTALHLAAMSAKSRETVEVLLMHSDIDAGKLNRQDDIAKTVAERDGPLGPLFDAAWPLAAMRHRQQ